MDVLGLDFVNGQVLLDLIEVILFIVVRVVVVAHTRFLLRVGGCGLVLSLRFVVDGAAQIDSVLVFGLELVHELVGLVEFATDGARGGLLIDDWRHFGLIQLGVEGRLGLLLLCWFGLADVAAGESIEHLQQDWLLIVDLHASLLGESFAVLCLTLQVGFGPEDGDRVVKAVKLHEFLDELCAEGCLRVLTHLPREWVLPVEGALLLLDLVLVVDGLEDAGAQLGTHLSEHTVGFERLDDKIFEIVHFTQSKLNSNY